MAYDKAVDSAVLDAGLTAIANAIREKGGTSDPIAFNAMAAAIAAIEAGGGDYDFSNFPRPITHVFCGSSTPASNVRNLSLGFESKYIPRIIVCVSDLLVNSSYGIKEMLVVGLSNDPFTEYETGEVSSLIKYGTGDYSRYFRNEDNYLYNSNSVYKFLITSFGIISLRGPELRYSVTSGSAQLAVFEGGNTYHWVALCEEVA